MKRTAGRVQIGTVLTVLSVAHVAAQPIPGPRFDPSPAKIAVAVRATSRAVTPMDLLTLRDPKGLSISPDGRYVAFVVGRAEYQTNSYQSAMYLISTKPGAAPENLGSAGMPHWDEINQWVPESPQWSPDSRMFTYRMRRSEQESWQVWAWDPKSRTRKMVTHIAGDVEKYQWFPNESRIFLTVKKRTPTAERGKLSEASILYDGNFSPWETVPIADAILRGVAVQEEYLTYDFKKRRERKAKPGEVARFSPGTNWLEEQACRGNKPNDVPTIAEGRLSPDGRNVACLYTVRNPDVSKTWARRLFVERLGSTERIDVTPNTFYVDQYWWSADGETIYYSELRGDGHSPRLMASSMSDGSSRPVFVSSSSEYFTDFAMDANSTHIVCVRERNTSPAEIVLLEASTGWVRTLVNLNPEFDNFTLSSATRMDGTNSYSDPWFAYLVKPLGYDSGRRYPLIVTTYRSGDYFLRGASGDESPVQVYAANGFAVLCFDVGAPRNLADGDFRTKLLDWSSPTASMEMAVQELVDRGLVDPERVGITGFSHGEEIVGYAVTHSRVFRAAVGAAGYDPSFYYLAGNAWQRMFKRWGLGGWPEGDSKDKWQGISMSLRADRVNAAILENASDSEYITYLPRVVSLQKLGKPVELWIYADERHVRNQPKHKYEIYLRNLDWFRFWLKGEEDNLRTSSEQIARWKKLRDRSGRAGTSGTPVHE